MWRHTAIGTHLHQLAKQGVGVGFRFNPVAFLAGRRRQLGSAFRLGQGFRKAAAQLLQALQAAGVKTHGVRALAALQCVARVAAGAGVGAAGVGAEDFQHVTAEGHVGEVSSFDQHIVEAGVEGEGVLEHGVA